MIVKWICWIEVAVSMTDTENFVEAVPETTYSEVPSGVIANPRELCAVLMVLMTVFVAVSITETLPLM